MTGDGGNFAGGEEGWGAAGEERATLSHVTCEEVILDFLAGYLENSLSSAAVAEMEGHLAKCKGCVAYLNTYKRTRELAGRVAHTAMPEEMKARLRRFLLERLSRP